MFADELLLQPTVAKALENVNVFKPNLNILKVDSARKDAGGEFQVAGADELKARSV